MIYFYHLIIAGSAKIPKSFSHALAHLQKLNVLESKKDFYKLKSDFIIGSVDVARSHNDKIFIKSFEKSHTEDFLLESSHPSIKRGDIILAKISKPKKAKKHKKDGKKHNDKGRLRAKFIALLYATKPYTMATLVMKKGKIVALELDSKHNYIELSASQKSLKALPKHCVIKLDITNNEIVEVFGSIDNALIDEQIVLSPYNRKVEFSKESIDFAKSFGERVDSAMYSDRVDLRHLPFCVIDPSNAKDHDDAIYFDSKSRVLYVAIADVSEYVSYNSALDKEARLRGFSIYFPNKVLPMLPFELSSGICSLKEREDRLAFVWAIELDSSANVLESKLFEAIIKSHANISYDSLQNALDANKSSISKDILAWLRAFVPYVKRLKANRLKSGYEFSSSEVNITLNESGEISSLATQEPLLAHSIIEESMLLANVASAKALLAQDLKHLHKGIFRIHPEPKKERIKELVWDLSDFGFEVAKGDIHSIITHFQAQCDKAHRGIIDSIIIKSFARATYSSTHALHFGLGFEAYTHFTSPIRRYSDLIVHRILKATLKREKILPFLCEHLHSIAQELNMKEKHIAHIEQHYYHLKIVRYAKSLLESSQNAIICNALSLDNAQAIALDIIPHAKISLNATIERHKLIKVAIKSADIITGEIIGEILAL